MKSYIWSECRVEHSVPPSVRPRASLIQQPTPQTSPSQVTVMSAVSISMSSGPIISSIFADSWFASASRLH